MHFECYIAPQNISLVCANATTRPVTRTHDFSSLPGIGALCRCLSHHRQNMNEKERGPNIIQSPGVHMDRICRVTYLLHTRTSQWRPVSRKEPVQGYTSSMNDRRRKARKHMQDQRRRERLLHHGKSVATESVSKVQERCRRPASPRPEVP